MLLLLLPLLLIVILVVLVMSKKCAIRMLEEKTDKCRKRIPRMIKLRQTV